ncbi:kynurenine formamidase isoform X2 [Gopherus flavomarginatus]|uniref:kynurenine formamidase isoform X2 n=1 Tax=Gopherus flavomarginatus TaxID=286002 RepID=UPI0021CBEA96|nr:kynurenine formamidase isoform X2 [Gopherus flavomarginatus]
MGRWQDMTQEELEKQYAPSRWSHRMDKEAVIEAHVREVTEAFPLVLYIHGGYWQFLSKEVSGFIAPPLVTQGIAVAAVGYDVAPKGKGFQKWDQHLLSLALWPLSLCALCLGHMDVMVAQVRRSVAFIVQQYSKTSGVYLCGHSAGAHLAAMVLSTDWEEYGVTPDIKGAFLVSGVYDLEPITHTSVNNLLHVSQSDCSAVTLSLPREVARRNSPVLCMTAATPARKACEVLIAVAQHDSPEFHRQSQEYFQALRSAGWSVSLLDIADTDHFDVIEKLSQGGYILTQVILNMISRA